MRIETKKKLPAWFNISDYDFYKTISDDEIIYQLSCRFNALIVEEYKKPDFFGKYISKGEYVFIPDCNSSISKNKRKDFDKSKYMSKGRAISPISLRDLNFLANDLQKKHNLTIDGKIENDSSDMYKCVSMFDPLSAIFDGIYCKIDLIKRDELIISDLTSLLKKWRDELGIQTPASPIKNSWPVIKDKILNYSAIPLFDLILWETATKNKITNGVLAVSLFPDGEYDSINIAQTIKPFVQALMDDRTIEKIEHEISKK